MPRNKERKKERKKERCKDVEKEKIIEEAAATSTAMVLPFIERGHVILTTPFTLTLCTPPMTKQMARICAATEKGSIGTMPLVRCDKKAK